MTLARYTRIHVKNFDKVFSEKPRFSSYQKTLYTTWRISFDEIQSQNKAASELLQLCSFLSNEDIWEEMLRHGQGLDDDGNVDCLLPGTRFLTARSLQTSNLKISFVCFSLIRWQSAREHMTLSTSIQSCIAGSRKMFRQKTDQE